MNRIAWFIDECFLDFSPTYLRMPYLPNVHPERESGVIPESQLSIPFDFGITEQDLDTLKKYELSHLTRTRTKLWLRIPQNIFFDLREYPKLNEDSD